MRASFLAGKFEPTLDCGYSFDVKYLEDRLKRGGVHFLFRTGSYIQKIAKDLIKPTKEGDYAPPGHPPHTRIKGKRLKKAITYYVEPLNVNPNVVIGPVFAAEGGAKGMRDIGRPHEWGGLYSVYKKQKKRRYPPRPFMGLALKKSVTYLPKVWEDSVKL